MAKLPKLYVAYDHDPANLETIELSVGSDKNFQPALRDVVLGRKVVWIRSDKDGDVWLRSSNGVKKVRAIRL
jgi:hypothetical protein